MKRRKGPCPQREVSCLAAFAGIAWLSRYDEGKSRSIDAGLLFQKSSLANYPVLAIPFETVAASFTVTDCAPAIRAF